jgi:hypothetical protein
MTAFGRRKNEKPRKAGPSGVDKKQNPGWTDSVHPGCNQAVAGLHVRMDASKTKKEASGKKAAMQWANRFHVSFP